MKEKLSEFIKKLKSNPRISTFDEASTKQAIILPILQFLGWNTLDIEEVTPEYTVENKKVDYSLRLNNTNEFFIEVKKPSEDLENHQDQLLDYSFRQGVELACLTNGMTWWFYLPTQKGTWRDRKFYTIDISQQDADDIVDKFIDLLSKDNLRNGSALKNALSIYKGKQKSKIISQTIPEAWNKIITTPDSLLVELLIETVERLCGYKPEADKIKEFLQNNRDQFTVLPNIEIVKSDVKTTKPKKESEPSYQISQNEKISQDDLIPYIIMVLYKFGGSATKAQVEDEIYKLFEKQFNNKWYHEKVSHGVERWRHNIAWAKERAIQRHNLIKPATESGRGIWELTNKGKEYYHKIKSEIEKISKNSS